MRAPIRRAGSVGIVLASLLVASSLAVPAASAAPRYKVGTTAEAYARWLSTPNASPPGVNVGCKPSKAHPRPVILLEGTTSRVGHSFWRLGPKIANAGYCAYGLDYGETSLTRNTNGVVGAMGDIATSAASLKRRVDQVLKSTGASKVDIVGWSQGGGPMPRYYIQKLGGAAKVNHLIGLAPSNYGTTFFGVLTAITTLEKVGGIPVLNYAGAPAFEQQLNTSTFITDLNRHGDTRPGVEYTVIETRYDDVVTPYTNAFLKGRGARNILLQDGCPADTTDHLGIVFDDNAAQYVLNALGPDKANFKPTCTAGVPVYGSA